MYSANELPIQDYQDYWNLLYTTFCEHIGDRFSFEGEVMIRKAVASMGHWQGLQQQVEHEAMGLNTNLSSLFRFGRGAVRDPREVIKFYTLEPEMVLWEQYTCPLTNYCMGQHRESYALFYWEEYWNAFISGYTKGKGQFHLSAVLADPRDICCQCSAYLRPANLDAEHWHHAFEKLDNVSDAASLTFMDYVREKAILLCIYMARELETSFGEDGIAVYKEALSAFEKASESVLEDKADRRGCVCDASFLQTVYPFANAEASNVWKRLNAENIGKEIQTRVMAPLWAKYAD